MRNRRGMWAVGCACAALSAGGVFVAFAGPVNPPSGVVAPTMHTLDDLFALSAQSGSGVTTSVLGPAREVTAMSITGSVQGPILGEDAIGGVGGVMGVYGFSHELIVPHDPATGLPTGVCVQSPIRVVKTLDKATPGLHKALCTGENLIDVQLKWFRIGSAGVAEQYFSVQLTDALVVGIRPFTTAASDESYRHMEEVVFTYSQITWTWDLDPANTHTDSWAPAPPP